jgi:glycosyltransferase involved in cell wall biosynthesis
VTVASIIMAALCALWVVQATLVFKHVGELRDLAGLTPPDPPAWPTVSVISAARDEADDIGDSLASRLSDGYPNLEVIVIDDRSEDATPGIIAEVARRDPRVRAVRVDELPDGWLGKVHALQRGVEVATGEWLLFSDADVRVEHGMVGKAVAHCEADGYDLLALVPEFRSSSRIFYVLWAIFMRVIAMVISPAAVRDPESKMAMGSGGFTLVRRSVFDATPGFAHLRLETADDVSLGAMVKGAGGRCDFMNGRGAASVSIYDSLREFYLGVEKNGPSLAGLPFSLLAIVFALLACVEYSPLVALAVGLSRGVGWLSWLGVATTLLATVATVIPLRRNTGLVWPGLLWPLGWALMASGVLRSAWLFHRRGGAMWRGTFYPKAEVLEAQRFKIW